MPEPLYRELCITAEPIKIPFGMKTRVGPRNHVLDEVQIPTGRGTFEGCPSHSELCNNGRTLTFAQYTDGKLLPYAIYMCRSLGDRLLYFREINDLKL